MRKPVPVEIRYQAKVIKSDGCWDWSGSKCKLGYGRIGVGRLPKLIHRVSYELHVGPIPAGLNVLHKCDNPSCSNPEHLFLGTHADNSADKMRKGRNSYKTFYGSDHGRAKLSDYQVLAIRKSDELSSVLAARYGVTTKTIRVIKRCDGWKHLP